jgi:hypothetical protein
MDRVSTSWCGDVCLLVMIGDNANIVSRRECARQRKVWVRDEVGLPKSKQSDKLRLRL